MTAAITPQAPHGLRLPRVIFRALQEHRRARSEGCEIDEFAIRNAIRRKFHDGVADCDSRASQLGNDGVQRPQFGVVERGERIRRRVVDRVDL